MMERKKAQGSDLTHELAKSSRLQGLLLDLWQRTRMDWGFVTDRLQAAFRAERNLEVPVDAFRPDSAPPWARRTPAP